MKVTWQETESGWKYNFLEVEIAGKVKKWEWDFGDGGSGSGKTTSHAYTQPGKYTVKLTITADHNEKASTSVKATAFKVELENTNKEYVKIGKTLNIKAKVKPAGLSGGTFSWATISPTSGSGSFTSQNPTTFTATGEGCVYPQVSYTVEGSTAKSTESKRILVYVDLGPNSTTTPTSNPTITNIVDGGCQPSKPTLEWKAYFDPSDKKWHVRVTELECTGTINISPWPKSGTPNPVPGGNVTENNYKDIIADLADYDTPGGGAGWPWHSTEATRAHEEYHWYTDWLKTCIGTYWSQSETDLENLSIPEGSYCKASEAKPALESLVNNRFNTFKTNITNKWNKEIAPKDKPGAGGGGYAAGQAVLNGIIDQIKKLAKKSRWK
ncbi:MAG TPA: PKD domain-containing protein [bacterium]|nr:PKD domain-containing protein [bacterium]